MWRIRKTKIRQSSVWLESTYHQGDIVMVHPVDKLGRLASRGAQLIFTPHTNKMHVFMIGEYIPEEKDYVIYESIPSHGVAIGRLSFYDGYEYNVLRLNTDDSAAVGIRAVKQVSKFGRKPYGYFTILQVVYGAVLLFYAQFKREHHFRALTARDMSVFLSYSRGEICTQLVPEVYRSAGVEILPLGDADLPCAYIEAVQLRTLKEVTLGLGKMMKPLYGR